MAVRFMTLHRRPAHRRSQGWRLGIWRILNGKEKLLDFSGTPGNTFGHSSLPAWAVGVGFPWNTERKLWGNCSPSGVEDADGTNLLIRACRNRRPEQPPGPSTTLLEFGTGQLFL